MAYYGLQDDGHSESKGVAASSLQAPWAQDEAAEPVQAILSHISATHLQGVYFPVVQEKFQGLFKVVAKSELDRSRALLARFHSAT